MPPFREGGAVFGIVQNLQNKSFLVGTFFAGSYSKTALGSQMALALYFENLKIEEYKK